ncbi:DMT family transporter [Bacillus sp. 1P06AnD]|uniref:DMT family transporter n=1 Tax=Bacillus sp. 1P06AnD TaxID=3132208 RepID=UPI0039A2D9AB
MNKNALLQLITAMAIFGSIGFLSPFTGLKALELVFVRCACAALFLGMAWVISGHAKKEKWSKKEWMLVLACGISNVLNWIFLFKSFELVSVTIAITLYHIAPILVLLMGSFVFRERLTLLSILAITLCFIGTICIVATNGFSTAAIEWKGIIFGIFAAFFYALTMLLGKSITVMSVYATTFIQMLVGLLLVFPFIDYHSYGMLSNHEWFFAIFTGFVHTGIVYLLFFNSIRYLPTAVVSFMIFVDPAVAILLDIVITDVEPGWMQWAGILFIFTGLFYSLLKPSGKSNQHASP